MNGGEERSSWEERYARTRAGDKAPSAWILDQASRLPNAGLIADLAGGLGRHAVPLVRSGREVILVDFVETAVRDARRSERALLGVVSDVGALPFAAGTLAGIVIANYLDRSLFPALAPLLSPGGVLLYETYTRAHLELVASGRAKAPRSERFVLEAGELRGLVHPLEVLEYSEGIAHDGAGERACARVVARKRD